jgi:hypothetical protein
MGTPVVQGEADEGATSERVGMWRALAGQVRKEQQAVAARRRRARLVDEFAELDAGGERVAVPAQAAARREHHAHHVPPRRDRVAERVQSPVGLDEGAVVRREHHTGGAE